MGSDGKNKKGKTMKAKLQMFGARVLVQEDKMDNETTSGIIIPGKEKEKTNRGTVIAVGDGAILADGTKVPMKVKVGDHVFYYAFSGSPLKENSNDEEEYLILNERDILCKIIEE